jgi:hypothetical protein
MMALGLMVTPIDPAAPKADAGQSADSFHRPQILDRKAFGQRRVSIEMRKWPCQG